MNVLWRKEIFDCTIIYMYNVGTTVKGGVDDLDLVIKTLSETGFTEDRFYIHCDGALFGFMLPFVDKVDNSLLLC